MKLALVKILIRLLNHLGWEPPEVVESPAVKPPELGVLIEKLEDVEFRAIELVLEQGRNMMGYEPMGWKWKQVYGKLASEFPWVAEGDLTAIMEKINERPTDRV